jgi:hypothetical protein
MTQLTDMEARTVNIFLQVPQYIILTIGECLFSITGLAFAYSQVSCSAILACLVNLENRRYHKLYDIWIEVAFVTAAVKLKIQNLRLSTIH